ncbi:uncharacterized protein B0I36DRAFT_120061 [Microdochium trichocladiopsis]|uniref:Uncharacterized protein n=1 Tax=Microdochium trichocladiopsis TaxID=1682393 RepID=A0A9P8Y7A5_9PEZI|nr:uncharacterized protein B0I36DRAFT_120061 [Microdochium trichocladiopsis]KAH7031213.1 hypothetical protein B0I36DRAFT_120061 [Microdochium trichocladiopsis]
MCRRGGLRLSILPASAATKTARKPTPGAWRNQLPMTLMASGLPTLAVTCCHPLTTQDVQPSSDVPFWGDLRDAPKAGPTCRCKGSTASAGPVLNGVSTAQRCVLQVLEEHRLAGTVFVASPSTSSQPFSKTWSQATECSIRIPGRWALPGMVGLKSFPDSRSRSCVVAGTPVASRVPAQLGTGRSRLGSNNGVGTRRLLRPASCDLRPGLLLFARPGTDAPPSCCWEEGLAVGKFASIRTRNGPLWYVPCSSKRGCAGGRAGRQEIGFLSTP